MKTCKDCVCYYDCLHSIEGLKSKNPDTCEYNSVNEYNMSTNMKEKYVAPTCEEVLENKKEFIKEVMRGVERKKSLKEYFDDIVSYKQYRDDVDRCLLYMDFNKIHRIMKMLRWTWYSWTDGDFNVHHGSVPSAFGIRERVKALIESAEKWINENPQEDSYNVSTGGFELNIYMVYDPETDDDYANQVRFSIKFVPESFDNAM